MFKNIFRLTVLSRRCRLLADSFMAAYSHFARRCRVAPDTSLFRSGCFCPAFESRRRSQQCNALNHIATLLTKRMQQMIDGGLRVCLAGAFLGAIFAVEDGIAQCVAKKIVASPRSISTSCLQHG